MHHNHRLISEVSMPDGGPVYLETDFSLFIVEPFNTASAAIFIIIAIYWLMLLSKQNQTKTFLFSMSILLLIGAIGGTLYHAFRNSELFLSMDWMPIMIITFCSSIYFLWRYYNNWLKTGLFMLLLLIFQFFTYYYFGRTNKHFAINLNYALTGLMVLMPLILVSYKHRFKYAQLILFALVCFIVALLARIYDLDALLPMGTHFLWHTFGALATHLMFTYLYKLNYLADSKYGE
ncbi:MAG: hypothetical protein ACK4K9_00715 [Bacteroidia bacterium]